MATISRFEDLEVWQKCRAFNQKICEVIIKIQRNKDYSLADQLSRSAGSCMDNIAEGFEREGNKEFIHFLSISKGSIGESRSQLYRAFDRKYIEVSQFEQLKEECEMLSRNISGFMNYLRNSEIKGNKYKRENLTTRSESEISNL